MAHDARRGVTERGPATVTHVQGAGRVRRYVLEVDLALALRDGAAAEVTLLGAHLGGHALQGRRGQANVDKAGTGDVHALHEIVLRQVVDDDLGDLARVLLGELGRAHGHGGRPVAVGLVARTLERRLGSLLELERSVFDCRSNSLVEDFFKLFANLHGERLSSWISGVYMSNDFTTFSQDAAASI